MNIYALSGGGQGSFGVASGMDINSGKWDHAIGLFSHREWKETRKWRKRNALSWPSSLGGVVLGWERSRA